LKGGGERCGFKYSAPPAMAKTPHHVELPLRSPHANESLSGWLYRELRSAILEGRLKPGTRLPTTRGLAAQYHLSRGIVVNVFEQLLAEGYLESRVGSGTSVNRKLPEDYFDARRAKQSSTPSSKPVVRGVLSKGGTRLAVFPQPDGTRPRAIRAFRANQPSVSHFPTEVWSRIGARRMRLASREMLLAGDVLGYRPLREAIAAHLGSTRGVVCTADQVMIVSGTQQALDLTTRLLLDPGDEAWMEDPGYEGAVAILRAVGAKLIPVPVDENGMRVLEGLKRAPKARFAFVTPAHQFPLGVTLTLERRLKLLEWSRSTGAWIFEDDYDSEFRFAGRPLAAMQGLAPESNVIFCGSFSKMLFPALRMGFLVVPAHLVDALCAARSIVDRFGPMVAQAVLCDFITEGHFGRHLRRMREVYAEHLEVLLTASRSEWGDRLTVQATDTGLQTVAWLSKDRDDVEFARAAADRGVEVEALSEFALKWKGRHGLQIGFASVGIAELRRGVRALASLL
jgi:GntR family transcriptional regulator/MocR family aminotransferase